MADIEHAKKYAEESISLAISMYNPKAEIIAETACLYGLTYKNEQIEQLEKENTSLKDALEGYKQNAKWCDKCDKIADLEKKNKVLAQNLEDTEIINKALEKENKELKDKLNKIERKCKFNFVDLLHDVENESKQEEQLTKTKELLKQWLNLCGFKVEKLAKDTEQFLNSEVEK